MPSQFSNEEKAFLDHLFKRPNKPSYVAKGGGGGGLSYLSLLTTLPKHLINHDETNKNRNHVVQATILRY